MTVAEFDIEFDVLYNNIKSASAPGLDGYEKSVFLTQAQRIFVQELSNKVDLSENEKRVLEKLTKQEALSIDATNGANAAISADSIFYLAPNALKINYEVLNITYSGVTKDIDVIPIKQDEYRVQKDNPFKKPNIYGLNPLAWRLDYGGETNSTIEIVPPNGVTINSYKVRYIKQPSPIILEDLSSLSLTIEGETSPATCVLNEFTHLPILQLAVNLAKQTYYENK